MNRTGVVVVTYNSAEVIERCLDSCGDLPVVVVDNASHDRTRELVRRRSGVKLLENASNRGFAFAVNQGAAVLDGELILMNGLRSGQALLFPSSVSGDYNPTCAIARWR